MPPPTPTVHPPPADGPHTHRTLAPGASALFQLPAGHQLWCLEGEALLESCPLLHGDVLQALCRPFCAGQRLDAAHTLWLKLTARTPQPVRLAIVEPGAAPQAGGRGVAASLLPACAAAWRAAMAYFGPPARGQWASRASSDSTSAGGT